MAKKPASAGFFMDKTGVIHNGYRSFPSFFSISRIPSPQSLQNLVNYHPIFCPSAGDWSFFVLFVNRNVVRRLQGFTSGWPRVVAGSSKNSYYTWRFSWLSLPTNVR
ncbi:MULTISPECIES: hypothetical protein [Enterobacterales]|uniref:hypothetical protein n=1 Tax=Enterobacterales TaxID=91347 RepID=UPI002ED9C5E7